MSEKEDKPRITFDQQKEIITEFLNTPGDEKEAKREIAQKYGISSQTVTAILNNNPQTQTEIERKAIAFRVLAENKTIAEIKQKALEMFDDTVKELQDKKDKHQYVNTVNTIINTIDKMYRLNFELPTEILNTKSQQTNTHYDIAKIIEQLKTPEEKMAFLLNQMENARNPKNNNNQAD